MRRKKFLNFAIMLCLSGNLFAQHDTAWTLQDCIEYALSHNIQLQKSKISQQESQIDVKTAKAAYLPSLSFSTNQNLMNRPYSESHTNIVDDGSGNLTTTSGDSKTSYNGSYGLNASWTIWNGGKREYNIRQQKVNAGIADLNIDIQSNSLEENIANIFSQIYYIT